MEKTVEKLVNTALNWIEEFLPHLLGAIIIIAVGMWLSGVIAKITAKAMERARVGSTVITFVHSFVKVAIKILIIIAALGTIGFNIASIITALGAATVAIGLALQDSLKNVASGIMILISKPFQVGDFIEVESFSGTVSKIDISNTHLLTSDNKEVVFPNSNLAVSNLVNFSSQKQRRVDLSFGISYNADIDFAKSVVKSVIDDCEYVLTEPEYVIAVGEHKESCIEIVTKIWCNTDDYWTTYYFMQENVKKAFDKNNIEIPFPQIDVHNS